jgi:Xaa-Pro dipeptidase
MDLPMSEFNRERAAQALEKVSKEGVDAILLFPGPNIYYYTGFNIGLSERLAAALMPVRGRPVFVVNELEEELRGQTPWFTDRVVWREHEDPARLLAETIAGKGLDSATIGLTEDAPWGWVNRLSALAPRLKLVDVSSQLGYIRMVKTPQEIGWIRDACAIADRALENAFKGLRTDMTEADLASTLTSEMKSLGGGMVFVDVLFGERAALPHGGASERKLRPGDGVLVDMGCTVHGYWSDITRTVFYGEPSRRQAEIYDVVLKANRAAFNAVRPSATCESIDVAGRRVIEDAGYGEYFIHRLGHGVGLQIHEHPYIVRNNTLPLAPGMTFSDEPGVYVVGELGVRVEDTLLCTEAGCESLTGHRRGLTSYPVRG